jgi:hypothetical protein
MNRLPDSFYFWLGREADEYEIRRAAACLAMEWIRRDLRITCWT